MSDTIKPAAGSESITTGNGGYRASSSAINTPGAARSTNTETPLINVQPAKRSDLQPSYAQLLPDDDDASTTGWYGAMSMLPKLTSLNC